MKPREAINRYYACFRELDKEGLRALLTPDFRHVSTFGEHSDRDEMLEAIWRALERAGQRTSGSSVSTPNSWFTSRRFQRSALRPGWLSASASGKARLPRSRFSWGGSWQSPSNGLRACDEGRSPNPEEGWKSFRSSLTVIGSPTSMTNEKARYGACTFRRRVFANSFTRGTGSTCPLRGRSAPGDLLRPRWRLTHAFAETEYR